MVPEPEFINFKVITMVRDLIKETPKLLERNGLVS
jgi:hypothetical protein